jgi:hypothetical protein
MHDPVARAIRRFPGIRIIFLIAMSGHGELKLSGRLARAARSSLALLVAALVCAGLGACGGGSGSASGASPQKSAGRAALPTIEVTEDADLDSDKYGNEPDNENEAFGHPAGATDTRLVTALVKRYYAAAAREDGAVACGLLYSLFAESVAETYGGPTGPSNLRGDTCAGVMTKLFTQQHRRLSDGTHLKVAAVRVDLNVASVQFGFGGMKPTRYVLARRERGTWKMDLLLDLGRPVGVE